MCISYKYKLNTFKYTLSLEFQSNPTVFITSCTNKQAFLRVLHFHPFFRILGVPELAQDHIHNTHLDFLLTICLCLH